MRKLLLALFLGGLCSAGSSQMVHVGSLETTDPVFNRPDPGAPPTTLSTVGTNVYYDVITFNVSTPGFLTITSFSTWDNYAVLYNSAGFDPAAPLTNALVANDDLSGTDFGFTYNYPTAGTYYLVITSFKNGLVGPYTVTLSPVTPLPLNLLYFTAEKGNASGNVVKWSAEEVNIQSYQVQRSADGKNFQDLADARLNAGNNNGNAVYRFIDKTPQTGLNFYRLIITERSGRNTMSMVVIVNNKKNRQGIVKVFPNPAANYLYIETNIAQSGKGAVSIINSAGAVMFKREYVLANQPVIPVDIRKLPRGKYFIRTVIDQQETVSSFIKN